MSIPSESVLKGILDGRELLFSPYQTIRHNAIDAALGLTNRQQVQVVRKTRTEKAERQEASTSYFRLDKNVEKPGAVDEEVVTFISEVTALRKRGLSNGHIVDRLFDACISHTQTLFYPYIHLLKEFQFVRFFSILS